MHLSGSFYGCSCSSLHMAIMRILRASLQHIGVLKRFAVRVMTLTLVGMMADRRADAFDVGQGEAVFLQDRLR